MRRIRYGCQTYPWKLHPERYTGEIEHIARVTAGACFEGLEAEVVMLGDGFRDDPERLKDVLEENGLELCTLVLHLDWRGMAETAEEHAEADRVIDYLSLFPKTKLMVSHHAVPGDRSADFGELTQRRRQVLSCMSAVACRAAEQGIVTAFHPNSSVNSLFRTREDYDILFEMLAPTAVGWIPDIGHLANGGMDPLEVLKAGRSLIRHVHFKDYAGPGQFVLMGDGVIDYPAIVRWLEDTAYGGWIVVEDESPLGGSDPDEAVRRNGTYMRQFREKTGRERGQVL